MRQVYTYALGVFYTRRTARRKMPAIRSLRERIETTVVPIRCRCLLKRARALNDR
jgi:hypothetical protein